MNRDKICRIPSVSNIGKYIYSIFTLNVPNDVKNRIIKHLPFPLPDVHKDGDYEMRHMKLTSLDYSKATVSMQNNIVTINLNDATVEISGFVRKWYKIIFFDTSSRADFKVKNHLLRSKLLDFIVYTNLSFIYSKPIKLDKSILPNLHGNVKL